MHRAFRWFLYTILALVAAIWLTLGLLKPEHLKGPFVAWVQQQTGLPLEIGKLMNVGTRDLEILYYGSLLHDIGKIVIPLSILEAPRRLTDEEMRKVDAIVRKTTVEKFGPVSSVTPSLVFELGFEGIALSKRHKSGIAVRFPRMLRWRHDKGIQDADSLETLSALLN